MILGMSLQMFTLLHVIIRVVAIATGLIVQFGIAAIAIFVVLGIAAAIKFRPMTIAA
jgi:hypothetical protein